MDGAGRRRSVAQGSCWSWAATIAAAFAPGAALAATDVIHVAPDVTVDLSGTILAHEEVGDDDLAGTIAIYCFQQ